jgi:hypothetical protein
MILNTGSRTDIPAYYSEWFYQRIKEGFVWVRNPYNPKLIHQYQLDSSVVDCIVFCTKNPFPMLNRLDELKSFKQFWAVTITPYGKDIEPNVPDKLKVIEDFKCLSNYVGKNSVEWRYDPVFISDKYTVEYHMRSFEKIAQSLSGYTNACVVSFIDLYEKTQRNFPGVKEVSMDDQIKLIQTFVEVGNKYNIRIKTCLEKSELKEYGADTRGCLTQEVIEKSIDHKLNIPTLPQARKGCECLLGNDIGAYNSCGHGCVYCYANYDNESVRRNMKLHKKDSPLLIGEIEKDDVIKSIKQVSYLDYQLSLF